MQIVKIVNQGAGLGYDETGKVVFVPCTAIGDVVEVEIVKSKKGYSVGRLKKILTKSPQRIESVCPHFGICGGCSFQHISYENELGIKKDIAEEIFKNKITQFVYCEESYQYRNKVSFHSVYRAGKQQLGFNMLSTNKVVHVDYCYLASKNMNLVKSAIERCNFSDVKKVEIRESSDSKSILVNIIGEKNLGAKAQVFVEKLTNEVKADANINLVNLAVWINGVFIQGIPLKKVRYITATVNSINYLLGADDFFQLNYKVSQLMFRKIKEYIVEKKITRVIDGFCGNFAIGMQLVDVVDDVEGVEKNKFAVSLAAKILKENNLSGDKVKLVCDDFTKFIKNTQQNAFSNTVLIVDPPRTGLEREAAQIINKANFKSVIYVSCDIMTAKRDIEIMDSFTIKGHYIYDMFPRTAHFENLIMLEKKG